MGKMFTDKGGTATSLLIWYICERIENRDASVSFFFCTLFCNSDREGMFVLNTFEGNSGLGISESCVYV